MIEKSAPWGALLVSAVARRAPRLVDIGCRGRPEGRPLGATHYTLCRDRPPGRSGPLSPCGTPPSKREARALRAWAVFRQKNPHSICCADHLAYYFAYSTALVSRMTLTLIWPGYSSSCSIFLAMSRARRIMLSSLTTSGLTIMRISRPA